VNRRLIGGIVGVLVTTVLAAVAWFVAVSSSSASPDPAPNTVVLAPHGGPPTIYAGPGDREQISGLWRFKKDPYNLGFDKGYPTGQYGGGELVKTPYVPDATKINGEKGIRSFQGSIGWYRTHVDVPVDGIYVIRFESVNHRARVYVDGKLEGKHKGEYQPFEVRVPLTAGTRHNLVVRADWRGPAAMKADGWHRLWFNFGGINRGVSIRRIGPSEISHPEMNTTLTDGAAVVDFKVHLRNNIDARELGVKGTLTRGDRTIPIEFPPEPVYKGSTEVLAAQIRVDKPDLWSPTAPNLWELALEVPGESSYRARVGLREVRADGPRLLLNGRSIRLRGASFHEDVFGRGDALRPFDQDRIIGHLKAIDANATRSQHPIDPGLLERLDAAGIMVWQGVGPTDAPGNWTSRGAERVHAARNRVLTSVRQGQLDPSIITWNLANEVAGGGHDEEQIGYIDNMAIELHRLDPSRPVALDIWGAHPPKETSRIYSHIDMIGWTNYIGWYEATNASADAIRDKIKSRLGAIRAVFPNKVIAVTEFGAEANGRNATTAPGGYAFQAHLLDIHLRTYASIPNLAGALIWNLRDFAVAPSFFGGSIKREVPGIVLVRGLNQKGLFDVRYKAKPSVQVVNGRFTAQAAAETP
jgi:hypothetical protein